MTKKPPELNQTDPDWLNSQAAGLTVATKNWDREQLFRLLFEQANVGVVLRDLISEQIYEINDRYLAILGKARAELGGFTFRSITHPDDQAQQDAYEQQMRAGQISEFIHEKRYLHSDGSYKWVLLTCSAVWATDNRPTVMIAIAQDITQSKLIELTLRYITEKRWAPEREDFSDDLCGYLAAVLNVSSVFIVEADKENQLFNVLGSCVKSTTHQHTENLNLGRAVWQTPAREPFFIDNCEQAFLYSEHESQQLPCTELAAVWLFDHEDQRQGLIALLNDKSITNKDSVLSILNLISGTVISELNQRKAAKLIWHQANFDALTNIPNRRLLKDRLKREVKLAQRNQSKVALLILDLDDFKSINDSLGHHIGDQLLKMVAIRLQNCVREIDIIARLGGDEFTVVLSNIRKLNDVAVIADKLLSSLNFPFHIDEQTLHISCSIGITVFPDNSETPAQLFIHGDQAMYLAKSLGKNRYSFFTAELNEKVQRRSKLNRDLYQAIAEQQLYLEFQPIYDVKLERFSKAEALVRWTHPEFGRIAPDEFIPITEENGLINDIGNWVFEQSVQKVQILRQQHADFQLTINKSPIQFRISNQLRTHHKWIDYMDSQSVSCAAIIIEMTESTFIDNSADVNQALKLMRSAGMQTAIDDFGTGHSAMAYLRRFDIDYLKIDQEFVRTMSRDSDDHLLCQAIIVMAHQLGLKVVAEGVETPEQLQLLSDAGADFLQGYYLSRPVAFEKLQALITANP